jgi:antitoxin VapB
MGIERHAKLFKNGRSQAVRIPREFEMPGTEVIIHKEGDRLVLEPVKRKSLVELLDSLEPTDEDFDFGEDLPAEPFEL